MITAKALKKDFIKVWLGDFLPSTQQDGIKALNKLCKQLCKEQREIIADKCNFSIETKIGQVHDLVSKDDILNARMPEL